MTTEEMIKIIDEFFEQRNAFLQLIIDGELKKITDGKPLTPGSIQAGKVTATWLENVHNEQLFTAIAIGKLKEYIRVKGSIKNEKVS